MGRKGIEVVVSELEREQLLSMSRSRSLPHSLVRRAMIVLMAADGHTTLGVARQREVTPPAITHWKKRFMGRGLAGLHDEHVQGGHVRMTMKWWPNFWQRCCMRTRMELRTGAFVLLLHRPAFRRVPWRVTYRYSECSLIVRRVSSFLLILTLSKRCAILLGCI